MNFLKSFFSPKGTEDDNSPEKTEDEPLPKDSFLGFHIWPIRAHFDLDKSALSIMNFEVENVFKPGAYNFNFDQFDDPNFNPFETKVCLTLISNPYKNYDYNYHMFRQKSD